MIYKFLTTQIDDRIAVITINRQDKLNALNVEIISELKNIFESLSTNDDVAVIILTGAGEKAFAAGADIVEISKLDEQTGKEFSLNGQDVFSLIENFNKPVIAAINGFALGGGCELALACHFRIASDNAKFGQPEINLGLIPGYGGTQRLTRLIGKGLAMELILTGDTIDANEAYRIGLVNKIFLQSELLYETKKIASKIASKSGFTISKIIASINGIDNLTAQDGLRFEAEKFGEVCVSEDFKEGTSAFLEKRKPEFKNK